jgi:hypothetical protein
MPLINDALSFKVTAGHQKLAFRLASDWRPVLTVLERDRKVPRSFRTPEQALRVSWRIVKDWVEAQMAIVETKMGFFAQSPERVYSRNYAIGTGGGMTPTGNA